MLPTQRALAGRYRSAGYRLRLWGSARRAGNRDCLERKAQYNEVVRVMDMLLSRSETVMAMFQLGMLTALWGIYTEVRRVADDRKAEKK